MNKFLGIALVGFLHAVQGAEGASGEESAAAAAARAGSAAAAAGAGAGGADTAASFSRGMDFLRRTDPSAAAMANSINEWALGGGTGPAPWGRTMAAGAAASRAGASERARREKKVAIETMVFCLQDAPKPQHTASATGTAASHSFAFFLPPFKAKYWDARNIEFRRKVFTSDDPEENRLLQVLNRDEGSPEDGGSASLIKFISNDPKVTTHEQGIAALVRRLDIDPSTMVLTADGTPIEGASSVVVANAEYKKFEALNLAISDNRNEEAKRMIEAGYDVNAQDMYGTTHLLTACRRLNPAMVRFLLAHGADKSVNKAETSGNTTPLKVSFVCVNTSPLALELIDALLNAGADAATVSNDAPPLLDFLDTTIRANVGINEENIFKAAEMLLTHGAASTINHVDGKGRTALGQAVFGSSLRLVSLFLAHGADPAIGKINDANLLAMAVVLRHGGITNALVHKVLQGGPAITLPNPREYLRGSRNEKTTLLHVLCLGGEHYVENIETICSMEDGLKALSVKDFEGKLPEQIMQDPTLKAKMKLLKEGYELFSTYLRVDISKDIAKLQVLEGVAKYISKCSTVFVSELVRNKAQRILKDLPIAEKKVAVLEKMLPLEESVERLSGLVGELKVAAAKDKKLIERINTQIKDMCEQLKEGYPKVKALAAEVPDVLVSLESGMRSVRGKKNTVIVAAINTLIPEDAAADKAAEKVINTSAAASAGAGAGAVAVEESGFDVETADLDVETLEAWMKASKSQQASLKAALDEKIAAGMAAAATKGEATTISTAALKRYMGKVKHVVEFLPGKLDEKVLTILSSGIKRGIPNMFIWSVLRFSEDKALKGAHTFIENVNISDAATFAPGSVHGSLINPGGKAPSGDGVGDGASTIGGDTWDGGSIMGGTVVGKERMAEVEEDAAGVGAESAAVECPRLAMPEVLPGNIDTLERLYNRDFSNLDEQGHSIHALFNALGGGFEAKFDDDEHLSGDLTITYKPLVDALKARGDDPKGRFPFKDHKHKGGFKGLHRDFALSCIRLLQEAGIEKRDIIELAMRTKAAATRDSGAVVAAGKPAAAGAGSL